MRIYRDEGFRPVTKRKRFLRPLFKRWSINKLLDTLRTYLQQIRSDTDTWITSEELSKRFCAKKHLVDQVIVKLRLEGIVGEELNRAPHDSNRDPVCGFHKWSAWGATLYKLKAKP